MSPEPHIKAIVPTQRDPNRMTIRVAAAPGRKGRVVATLNARAIHELGLAVGMRWDDALAERIAEAATYDKAFRSAMNRLAKRAMSQGMLHDKLRQAGHGQQIRDAVMQRLDKLGLIDDEAFGRALIAETTRAKPAGPRLLRQKLFQKRLDEALINRLLAEHADTTAKLEDPHAEAIAFAQKRARLLARFDAATRRRRLYGQLARRGFDTDTITAAMNAALRDDPDDDDSHES